jgi:hypothetical protein
MPREACPIPEIFTLCPGVIADTVRGVTYLMNPHHGIDAVDLSSGRLLWRTSAGAKPLLVDGDRLIAQAEVRSRPDVLRLIVLDRAREGAAGRVADVALPGAAWVGIDDGPGASFQVEAHMLAGKLVVAWTSSARPLTGVAPPSDIGPADHTATGTARIDLDTGRVESVAPTGVTPPPACPLPDTLARQVESAELPHRPWRAGGALALVVAHAHARLVLKRWQLESGAPLADVTLAGDGFVAWRVSADRQHVLVSKAATSDVPVWEEYAWSIYSLASGERVAISRSHSSADWFFLLRRDLVHESRPFGRRIGERWVDEPRRVRAFDLDTGRERWASALRDTTYRGPEPPHGGATPKAPPS